MNEVKSAATTITTAPTTAEALSGFQPAVASWFLSSFGEATAPQRAAWPLIRQGLSTLVFAPTGSGKTLAAFFACIDKLVAEPSTAVRPRGCRVLYISPLKALASDVERNLQAPLVGIARVAALRDEVLQLPTIAVRTGDTPPKERARFARAPADILITTPESLFLLLTSKARAALVDVETVIVDEIHALVPSKRGAHLAVSLARLEALRARPEVPLQRIGLSATQRPLDEVARYLGGYVRDGVGAFVPAPVTIVDARGKKRLEVTVEHTLVDEDRPAVFEPAPSFFAPLPTLPAKAPVAHSLNSFLSMMPAAEIGVQTGPLGGGPLKRGANNRSTWTTIPPKVVALAAQYRTVLVFVNSRRLTERLAAAVNDEAGSEIAAAHHGSLARAQRQLIEERLKLGLIKVLVCTSSLELGVDMGSIDVVVQVEAPPSVASALQRIGRAGHQVGAVSRGVVFPRYATDLLACAATTGAMHDGVVEATRYPRNPLDILAQQLVAMVAVETWPIDKLFDVVRQAAPFAELPRVMFDSVIDMLAGKTAIDLGLESHEGLRARVKFDRDTGLVTATMGAHRVVVQNAGTIVDRGLYGVFLANGGEGAPAVRVGELDEEMVFETRPGEVFRLGASSWRVEEITHDRVLVTPAPGQPGKLPFWRGESPLRPLELGERMGALTRELLSSPRPVAIERLMRTHGLVELAADKLVSLLTQQQDKGGGVVPDDRTIVVERGRDELGDWRVCILSPLGAQVLQPLGLCIVERASQELGLTLEIASSNDGIVLRFPESDEVPDIAALLPTADDVERLVLEGLSGSAMFAARFRESAARALLLPRRRPGMRAPLWKQRQRSQDLLTAVSKMGEFPIVLETCRECLRDIFDVPALVKVLEELGSGLRRLVTVDSDVPSPFAAALLSGFIRGAIYDGDVPLAERRAQALSIDHDQLKTLLGDGALRELLDDDVIAAVDGVLQSTAPGMGAKHPDGLHALLVRLGDLTLGEIAARTVGGETAANGFVDALVVDRRAVWVKVGGAVRLIAVEDVGRYRDALGVQPPAGIPDAFLSPTTNALTALLRRYVKSHALTTAATVAARFSLATSVAVTTLQALVRGGVLVEGAFRPGGDDVDYADPEVLRSLRRRTLARLRQEIEPVDQATFVRAQLRWHGLSRKRRGLDGLLDVIGALQGAPLLWSTVESGVLPARVVDYRPEMLDALALAGEVLWVGVDAVGEHDARVMLFLADALPALWRPPLTMSLAASAAAPNALRDQVINALRLRGASFFAELLLRMQLSSSSSSSTTTTTTLPAPMTSTPSFSTWMNERKATQAVTSSSGINGGAIEAELWSLAMAGVVTNDSFRPLRARLEAGRTKRRGERRDGRPQAAFRSRRQGIATQAEGRWSLLLADAPGLDDVASLTRRSAAVAEQLVRRHGVLAPDAIKEALSDGGLPVPLPAVRDALRALEDAGRVRRGYFVSDLGGMQYAAPDAVDALRGMGVVDDEPEAFLLDSSDPANPYGGVIDWPRAATTLNEPTVAVGLHRGAGARVVIVDGTLAAYLPKSAQRVTTFLPPDEPERARVAGAVAQVLAELGRRRRFAGTALLLGEIDGLVDPAAHPLTPYLLRAGFVKSAGGLLWPRAAAAVTTSTKAPPSAWLGAPLVGAAVPTTTAAGEADDVDGDGDLDGDDDD